jgi:hypothetical protein
VPEDRRELPGRKTQDGRAGPQVGCVSAAVTHVHPSAPLRESSRVHARGLKDGRAARQTTPARVWRSARASHMSRSTRSSTTTRSRPANACTSVPPDGAVEGLVHHRAAEVGVPTIDPFGAERDALRSPRQRVGSMDGYQGICSRGIPARSITDPSMITGCASGGVIFGSALFALPRTG